jgi:D-sedoheptulose 7-phosphate isomerase
VADLVVMMNESRQGLAREHLRQAATTLEAMLADDSLLRMIDDVVETCAEALRARNKILFVGNGGSAADAQHLAAELVGRFAYDRPGLPAIALTTDSSALTAIGNDYGYEHVFARQVEAVGTAGDVLFALSTSGRSPNVVNALRTARGKGLRTIGLTGRDGRQMVDACDYVFLVPSDSPARIQEGHIVVGHIICGLIEQCMYPQQS